MRHLLGFIRADFRFLGHRARRAQAYVRRLERATIQCEGLLQDGIVAGCRLTPAQRHGEGRMSKRVFQVELDEADAADLEQLAASLKVPVDRLIHGAVIDAICAKRHEQDSWRTLSDGNPDADALDD